MNHSVEPLSHVAHTHVGIVLRFFSEKSRVVIFDRFRGKFSATCFSTVSPGSYVSYELSSYGSSYNRVKISELLHVPLLLARSNIILLHQVLEICDVSLPLESIDGAVYDVLLWLCTVPCLIAYEHQRDLILAKLFVLLGLHTTYSIICETCIVLIHNSSVDTIGGIALDSKCAEKLKSWLYHCLSEQLSEQPLKTRVFFNNE